MMKKQILFGIALIVVILSEDSCNRNRPGIRTYDVVIYGGTPAGITAAIQVAREGKTVVLLEPSGNPGGIMVNGLGGTDIDNHPEFQNSPAVGGLALEFYRKVALYYGRLDEFDSKLKSRTRDASLWQFEPHVASEIIQKWLKEYPVTVILNSQIEGGKDFC